MDEGALGMHKKHVGDPDLLHQAAVKCHAEVVGAWEGQPLVLPIVPQVEGHGEVLGLEGPHTEQMGVSKTFSTPVEPPITWLGMKQLPALKETELTLCLRAPRPPHRANQRVYASGSSPQAESGAGG